MARALTLYETYTRQEVHDLFDPGSRFTPSAGTWGLWGIVPIPQAAGDFVLFVTFGREQAGHAFDEWITESGVINWQSQPRQGLADRQIQQFIHHDPARNNIHLFLRTRKTSPYTYLGRLAYHTHDPERERPVYIQWQILDWPPSQACLQAMGLALRPEESQPAMQLPGDASFDWRGVQYPVNRQQLQSTISRQIVSGLPEEALRFRDWYIEIGGQRLSAKWIFHLITGAGYNEFDAPTARNKLAQIGLVSKPVDAEAMVIQLPLEVPGERLQIREGNMYRAGNYKDSTARAFIDLLNDLIMMGEVPYEQRSAYSLTDYHLIDLFQSTLVLPNPHAFIASPRLLNQLPLENIDELLKKLSLTNWGYRWQSFPVQAFNLLVEERYAQLNNQYYLVQKPDSIYDDTVTRPVFLFNYFTEEMERKYWKQDRDKDWEDWTIDDLFKLHRVYTEPKLFVHSTLPIQNLYGGLSEVQFAAWKSAFYWIMIQLIILSDPQTGAVYDPQIQVMLSNNWRDNSTARLYLRGDYIGDLVDCMEGMMNCFRWVWVNRSGNAAQDQQSILSLLRLLLKIDIAELGKDGRLLFTDHYRSKLFERQEKARLAYQASKDARDQLREAIKDMQR